MSKFAEQANKAAQSLSTTTTRYTDAALIYYQQGLSDEEVLGRAETTIKLANVSRQSTEEVSDQLTAIWNNFYDGSQNLEYYADVITALGAATASSSEEISTGLEKFAAVSKTVGLSYEYATAALATITATTRQSADTVGTGLRTLFTRLEGLKLGKTLEDGVDLNKYSEALSAVGVQILDTSGELRNMDDILEDLGVKWQQLGRDQKMALAQTVGGVRQYTNLIALMDHWDFMQENLTTARGSEGTLQQQADIYAESWEAAQKRVRAAAEDIYKSLLNDKFFIELNNGFADVLKQIGNIIEGIGGFKGVLITLGAVALNVFNKQITSSLDNLIYSITMLTEQGRQSVYKLRDDTNKELTGLFQNDKSFGGQSISAAYASQSTVQSEYLKAAQNMTEEQQKIAQILLDQHNTLVQNTIAQSNLAKEAEKEANIQQRKIGNALPQKSDATGIDKQTMKNTQRRYLTFTKQNSAFSTAMDSAFGSASTDLDALKKEIPDINERIQNLKNSFQSFSDMAKLFGNDGARSFQQFASEVEKAGDDPEKIEAALTKLYEDIGKIEDKTGQAKAVIEGYGDDIAENMAPAEEAARKAGEAAGQLVIENANLSGSTQNFAESLEKIPSIISSQTASLVSFGQRLSTIAMGINTIINLGKTWSNTDLSFGEKMLQTMTSLSMIIPLVTTALGKNTITKIANTTATKLHKIAEDADTTSIIGNTAATMANYLAHAPLLAIILALTAAIVALTSVVYLVAKAYNKSADDAKKASKATEELKEQYRKTKESYEELKKSVEDHENAVKAIDKLKHGTEEWRDAIQEANEKVLELISNYPQLAAAVNRNENGILTIDQNSSAYQTYLEEEKKRMNSSFRGSIAGNIIANNANYTNDLVQASRKMWYGKEDETSSQVSETQLRQAVELFNKDNSLFVKGQENKLAEALNTTNTNLCAALINNVSAIEKLATELSANTTANQLAAEQIGIAAFKEQNSGIDDKYIQAVSGILGGNYQEALEKANNNWADTGKFGSGPSDEIAQREYAKEMGYTWKKNLGNNMGQYTDDKGQIIEIDDAVVREYLAVRDATAAISENLDSAKQAIENLQIGAKNLGNEIGDNDSAFGILTGTSGGKDFNFSKLTEEQFEGIKRAWKAASEDGSMTGDEFLKYFGISDEYAKSKGYESGFAMAQAFANGIDNYTHDVKYKNILESLIPTVKSFEEASVNYNTITSAGSNIKENNSIIDDKSYQALAEAGIAVSAYFEQMADGTHQLMVDASEFKRVVEDIAMKELFDAEKVSVSQTSALNNFITSSGFSSLISKDDKNSILKLAGVSNEEIANLAMIENGDESLEAYANKFKELNIDIDKANKLLETSAENTAKIQQAIDNTNFKNDVDRYGLNLEETTQYAKELENQFKNTGKSQREITKASRDLAISNQRLDKGLDDLNSNFKNYQTILKSSNKGTAEYSKTMTTFKDSLSNVLNVADGDMLSDTFAETFLEGGENAEKFKQALDGDADAILELRMAAADDIMLNLVVTNNLDIAEEEITTKWQNIKDIIESDEFKAPGFDQTQLIASFNDLIEKGQMTKEQIEAALAGLHVSANVHTDFVEQPIQVPQTITEEAIVPAGSDTVMVPGPDGTWTEQTVQLKRKLTRTYDAGVVTVNGVVPKYTLEGTEGEGEITSGITALPPPKASNGSTTSGKNSGGGGGGGGSSKAYTPRKRKTDDAEKERYVEINAQLKTTSQLLNKINTAKDRAYGGARVKHIDEEISALNREYGQLQQLIKEDEEWLKVDKGKIAEYGLTTNKWDNNINNYDEIFDAEKAKLIAAYDLFDQKMQSAIDETEKKELEKEIEKAEERFGKFQEVVNQYHTTLQKLEDDNQKATENRNKVYDEELEKITHMIDVWDDYYDRELKYLDFLLNQIGDGADRALDRMGNYTEKMGRTFDKIDNFQEGIEETLDHMGLSLSDLEDGFNKVFDGDNWTKDIDALKNYQDSLISLGNELLELRRTLLEEVSAAFDEFNSDLDRAVDGVDHLRRFTETYKNILDIVGKDVIDPTGRTTNMLARTAFTQAQANANALQTQLDMQLSAIDDYNRTIANLQADNRYGEHDDIIKEFKNQLKEAEDAYAATQEEWLRAWEETVQAAADIYEATMLQIIEDFGKSISGLAGSLEELDTRFNRAKSLADTYVDDYEKIYQLSKLNRDINNSIDDTDNIRSKQRLRDLQEQINDLQASDNQMSEYEIENLRRRYELELAYLQLEEARDAKSQVRMVRDNEGNWGYIYTADETAVEEAEQNYEDKLYAMQKANTEYIESLESEILQLEQEWSDALAGIRVQDYASYEEYQEAIDRTNDYYTQKLDQTYEQMGIAIDNNKVLYDEDWAAYSAATGYKISEDERFIDDFKETTLSLTTGYQTIEDAQNAFRDATLNVTNDMVQAFQDWERDTNTSLELGGTNIQNYAEDVNEAINGDGGIVDQTEDAVEAVETMSDEYQDAFTEIIDYAGTFCSQFDSVIDDIVDDCNRAIEAIQNLLEAMGEEVERNDPNDYTWKNLKEGTGEYEWVYENSAGKRKTGNFRTSYTAENGESYMADFFADASGILQASKENSEHNGLYGASNIEWIKKAIKEAAHADTGMYTGNWGSPEGRLAVLHEKELVLNKDDTSNFLSAIGMIRDISSMIDLNSITSSNLMASMFGIRGVSTGTDTLEQDVTIHAEFPNVQNHSEIEEAFDNLINKASQYANRKI